MSTHRHNSRRNQQQTTPVEKKRHFKRFHIAGFAYYEGCDVFQQLKIGTRLRLVRDAANRFDPNAIAIYFGDAKLGFVPASEAAELAIFFDMGYGSMFECAIQTLDASEHPEHQVCVRLCILKKSI
ncbi:MAG: HIRAN domain-containing protein [Paludibacteraceae bacterium]|nr:HIRAN domain-containing protein [Paludibacteraceae bacterium]